MRVNRLQALAANCIKMGWPFAGYVIARSALFIDGRDTASMFNAALALQRCGRLRAAADRFTHLIAISSGDREALLLRADLLCDLGDWRAAIKDYSAALALAPDADALLNRGVAHATLGDWASAEADFLGALAIVPSDEMALRNLTRVRRRRSMAAPDKSNAAL